MTDELDRLLAGEDDVVPSSGFTEAVMEGVRAAKAAPPPIPFPWTRALLALGALAVILGVSASGLLSVASLSAADGWSFAVPPAVRATIQAVDASGLLGRDLIFGAVAPGEDHECHVRA